jgi:Leucine-rich repeat (LRR) protein
VELNLQHNALRELPPNIGLLASLRILDVSQNQIASVADEIQACSQLERIDLSGTPMRAS